MKWIKYILLLPLRLLAYVATIPLIAVMAVCDGVRFWRALQMTFKLNFIETWTND